MVLQLLLRGIHSLVISITYVGVDVYKCAIYPLISMDVLCIRSSGGGNSQTEVLFDLTVYCSADIDGMPAR